VENKNSVVKLSLFAITWPIFIEMGLQTFLRTADTFMLSRVSDEAVAAVGVSNQIIMFAFFMLNIISLGAAVVITQYLGAKKHQEIGKLVATSILLNLLFGLLISSIIFFFSNQLLNMFGLEDILFGLAKSYLVIAGSMMFVQAVFITVVAIIQSHGYTRETMLVTVFINILNIIGNYLFIYGALGFPQLGVPGVAISTVFSQCVGLLINLYILTHKVRIRLTWKHFYKWQKDHVTKILKIGLPSSATMLSYNASQIITTSFIVSLGAEELTTRIYTQNVMFFIMVLAISLGRGGQIITGHLVGAGEMDHAYKQTIKNLKISWLITIPTVVVINLFSKQILGLFTSNPEIVSLGVSLLLLGFLLEPGRNFNIVVERSLQAAGDARYSMVVSICVIWCFTVPVTYLMGIHWGFGLIGIWITFVADEWIRGLFLYFRWRSRAWENKALVKQKITKPKAITG